MAFSSAHAADVYWDINGTTAGAGSATPAGTWSTGAANWSTDSTGASATAVWNNGDNAIFSAGTDATGSYTVTMTGVTVGNITQEEGKVRLNNGGTITLASASSIFTTSTRNTGDYDLRIDGVIAGSGTLAKEGAGYLLLVGANTFSGGTSINGGSVFVESQNSAFGTGAITLNGGNLAKTFSSSGVATTLANAINVTADSKVAILNQSSVGDLLFSGTWQAGSTNGNFNVANITSPWTGFTFTVATASIKITGDISAYTGTFTQNTLAAGGNRLRFGPTTSGSFGTVNGANAKFATTGSTAGTVSVMDLADGAFGTWKMGELSGTGGVVTVGFGATTATAFQIGSLNTASKFGGLLKDNVNAANTGKASLEKVGTGTLELSLASGNTYSGGTLVSGGTLLVSNTSGSGTGTSAVSVGAAGTLGGTGRIAPSGVDGLSISGLLAPGGSVSATTGGSLLSSIGTLTLDLGNTTGTVSMLSGSGFKFELGTSNASIASIVAGSSDLLTLTNASTGDFAFSSNSVNFLGSGTQGYYKVFDTSLDGTTWTGLSFDGTTGVVSSGLAATNLASGASAEFIVGTAFNGADSIGDIYVHVIPEPTSAALLFSGMALFGLGRLRRERMLQSKVSTGALLSDGAVTGR